MRTSVHDLNSDIHSHYTQDNSGNFNIDTHSPSITCNIDAKTTGTMIIDVKQAGGNSTITLNADGTLIVDTSDKVDINAANVINLSTKKLTFFAPNGITMTGDTILNGSLVSTKTITDSGATLATHIHGESHGNTTPPL
jgi:hypothetical protein